MLGDARLDELAQMRLELAKRPLLVLAHQPAVARDIGRQNRRELAFSVLLFHRFSRASGEIGGPRRQHNPRCSERRQRQRCVLSPKWSAISAGLVNWVDPANLFGLFHRLDVQIHDHGLVVAAHHDALEGVGGGGVDLLMGNEGRHENEITGPGLGDVFEALSQRIRALPLRT